MGGCWLARGVRGGGEGRTTRRKMASKESKRPCGAARAGTAGGGGRARPRHAPAKGANWREEQGAGPGARLGARLEGPTRYGIAARRAPSTSGAGRGAAGWAPFPLRSPNPPPPSGGGAPFGALGSRAEAASATGKRTRLLLPRARVDRFGVAALVRGILEHAGLWLLTRASWERRPLLVGDGGSGPRGFCYTWIRLSGWVVEPLCIWVVILEQVRTAVSGETKSLSV